MKNLIAFFSMNLLIIIIFTSLGQAQFPSETKLNKKINSQMVYPLLANENMEGEVTLSFTITPKGRIDVLKIDSSNPHLIPYVMRRLKKIEVPLNDKAIGTIQNYLINFKSEEANRI
jgi:hypothetical protein